MADGKSIFLAGLTMSKNGSMFQRGDSREATIMKGERQLLRNAPRSIFSRIQSDIAIFRISLTLHFFRSPLSSIPPTPGQSAVRDVARRIPGFPSRITTIACRYFEGAVNNGFTKGRTRDHVAAACLFMSCRLVEVGSGEKGQPFMLMDFSTVIKVSKWSFVLNLRETRSHHFEPWLTAR